MNQAQLMRGLIKVVQTSQGLEDPRVGTLNIYKDEDGVIHVPVIDFSEEWKLEDKVWVKLPPF